MNHKAGNTVYKKQNMCRSCHCSSQSTQDVGRIVDQAPQMWAQRSTFVSCQVRDASKLTNNSDSETTDSGRFSSDSFKSENGFPRQKIKKSVSAELVREACNRHENKSCHEMKRSPVADENLQIRCSRCKEKQPETVHKHVSKKLKIHDNHIDDLSVCCQQKLLYLDDTDMFANRSDSIKPHPHLGSSKCIVDLSDVHKYSNPHLHSNEAVIGSETYVPELLDVHCSVCAVDCSSSSEVPHLSPQSCACNKSEKDTCLPVVNEVKDTNKLHFMSIRKPLDYFISYQKLLKGLGNQIAR